MTQLHDTSWSQLRLTWTLAAPNSAAEKWGLSVIAHCKCMARWKDEWTEHPVSFDWSGAWQDPKVAKLNWIAARLITKECPELAQAIGICASGRLKVRDEGIDDISMPCRNVNEYPISTEDACLFLTEWTTKLQSIIAFENEVFVPTILDVGSPRTRLVIRRSPVDFREASGLFSPSDLLQFHWDVVLNSELIDIAELESMAESMRPLVAWRGKWIYFDPKLWSVDKLQALVEHVRNHPNEGIERSVLLDALFNEHQEWNGIPIETVPGDGSQCDWFARLTRRVPLEDIRKPETIRTDLRHYQMDGLNWLAFMGSNGFGACLADDMGLGKTLQTLAWLEHDKLAGHPGYCLLVCPTSLVRNWQKERDKYAPELRICEHHGPRRAETSQALLTSARGYDVVITTYGTMTQDIEMLSAIQWRAVILDEAQNIKNPDSGTSRAARQLGKHAPFRLALTGTPIENSALDLWALFDFLNPGLLGSNEGFRTKYQSLLVAKKAASKQAKLETEQIALNLQRLTTPFILRRKKSDPLIEPDLPDKIEIDEFCHLTVDQAKLYRAVPKETEAELERAERGKRNAVILKVLTQLKQVCNHPSLMQKDRTPLDDRSGKLNRLVEVLEEVIARKEKALVFTQYAEMGRMLDDYLLDRLNVGTQFLCGDDSIPAREKKIATFTEDSRFPIFILTYKAGGAGLNLQAANHVFCFDRWWNPAVESQAADRAYRIGQSKDVNVYKFVCVGTVEERIAELLSRKLALSDMIIGNDLDGSLASTLAQRSNEELHDFFRLDAEAVCED